MIKAEVEQEAVEKLAKAGKIMDKSLIGLELRLIQMISEVGAEQNTIIMIMPSEFVTMAKAFGVQRAANPSLGRIGCLHPQYL